MEPEKEPLKTLAPPKAGAEVASVEPPNTPEPPKARVVAPKGDAVLEGVPEPNAEVVVEPKGEAEDRAVEAGAPPKIDPADVGFPKAEEPAAPNTEPEEAGAGLAPNTKGWAAPPNTELTEVVVVAPPNTELAPPLNTEPVLPAAPPPNTKLAEDAVPPLNTDPAEVYVKMKASTDSWLCSAQPKTNLPSFTTIEAEQSALREE